MKKLLLLFIPFLFICCAKLDDPEISPFVEINYSAPCTDSLTDNLISTSIFGFDSDQFILQSPTYNPEIGKITGNPTSGSVYIWFGTPLTESGTWEFEFPFLDDDEVKLEFKSDGFLELPFHPSQGTLYVEYISDEQIILEFCIENCYDSGGNQKDALGRIVIGE